MNLYRMKFMEKDVIVGNIKIQSSNVSIIVHDELKGSKIKPGMHVIPPDSESIKMPMG
jgi:hypothetical protein